MVATKPVDIIGRRPERDTIDRLLDGVRRGESGALVIRGEAGIGKTALLDYAARRAVNCSVVRIEGVESELGLPFAALDQLCAPLLGELETLPDVQRRALRVALGMEEGPAPDPFIVGLAVLILLSDAGAKQPLVVLLDDAQWIDDPSRQVLAFVSRRVAAEAVLFIWGVREAAEERLIPGLADLTITGLTAEDTRALLDAANPGGLDPKVRSRVVAETGGNPLWLLELSRAMTGSGASGGIAISTAGHAARQLQDHYTERIGALPGQTQGLMQLAAAEPTGDAGLVWRAADTMGIGRDAAGPAADDELLDLGETVRFRHPLVRSAAYASGSDDDRRAAHAALAAATDPEDEPALHAWHRAEAAHGPDEDIASELERVASIAQARAGLAAAAEFLERSVALTADPERRADRALAGAEASMHAGAFDAALGLLAQAEASAIDDLQRARAERMRGRIQWTMHPGGEAPILLLQAASRLEPLDAVLARDTYLEAWMASFMAGRHAMPGGGLREVSEAALAAGGPPDEARPPDLFLDGVAREVTQGRAAAVPSLRAAVDAFLGDRPTADWLQWGHLTGHAASVVWDIDRWGSFSEQQVEHARASGALAPLSIALNSRGSYAVRCGELDRAAELIAEEMVIDELTGIHVLSVAALTMAAYRGSEAQGAALTSAIGAEADALGQGLFSQCANWATAILMNGLGRYKDALAAAQRATDESHSSNVTGWALPELIEAAVRTGEREIAVDGFQRLLTETDVGESDWAKGVEACARALVSEGDEADRAYAEAVERLGRTPLRPDLARAHLLYGEWLRHENRVVEARHELRIAFDMLEAMGAEAFAERARRELLATGERAPKRPVDERTALTPQELHIARLARDGRTDAEIGTELFLSPRAVEWHLGHVFSKLGITSREELGRALPSFSQAPFATVT